MIKKGSFRMWLQKGTTTFASSRWLIGMTESQMDARLTIMHRPTRSLTAACL